MVNRNISIASAALRGSFWRVNLSVTNRCNSRCVTCNIWKNTAKDELSASNYESLFRGLGPRLRWLHVTGGEPFLRSDLQEIVESALELCPNLCVVDFATNGFLSDDIVKVITALIQERSKVLFAVGISIDGRPDIHEYIRNMKGCWEKAERTFDQLEKLSRVHSNLQVHVNFTVSPWNIGEISQFCSKFPKMSPVSLSVYHLGHSFKNSTGCDPGADFYKGAKSDISWFLQHGQETSFVKKLFLRLALTYLDDVSKPVLPCEAVGASCFIDPHGDVFPCTLLEYRLGNILEDPKLTCLNSANAKELRLKIKTGLCNCWSGCECWSSILRHTPKAIVKAYGRKIPKHKGCQV